MSENTAACPLLTIDRFKDGVGEVFTVEGQEGKLTLVEVAALPVHEFPGRQIDPFHLIFRGPGTLYRMIGQGVYRITNPKLGEFSLLLVPGGPVSPEEFAYAVTVT